MLNQFGEKKSKKNFQEDGGYTLCYQGNKWGKVVDLGIFWRKMEKIKIPLTTFGPL